MYCQLVGSSFYHLLTHYIKQELDSQIANHLNVFLLQLLKIWRFHLLQ